MRRPFFLPNPQPDSILTLIRTQMDRDHDSDVDMQEWIVFLSEEHARKREKKKGRGDQWLNSLLSTLREGIDTWRIANHVEDDTEAAIRKGPTDAMISLARQTFVRIAKMSEPYDVVSKSDVVTAQRGDFGLFGQLDTDGGENVTLKEFIDSITRIHSEKRAKKIGTGDKWLNNLLKTLASGCLAFELNSEKETEEEAAERTGPTTKMMKLGVDIFKRMSEMSPGEMVTEEDFITAHRGDFGTFKEVPHPSP